MVGFDVASMPEEGSSRRRTVGFHMRAMPRESLRSLPPEGFSPMRVWKASSSTARMTWETLCSCKRKNSPELIEEASPMLEHTVCLDYFSFYGT